MFEIVNFVLMRQHHIKYYDDNSKKVSWKGTPVPENAGFGFEEINWISAGGEEKA